MVNVGLFVRLEVKPGKESEVENLLRAGILMVKRNQQQQHGLELGSVHQLLVFLMHFQMNQAGKNTYQANLLLP